MYNMLIHFNENGMVVMKTANKNSFEGHQDGYADKDTRCQVW